MIDIECNSSGQEVLPSEILSQSHLETCDLFISVRKPRSMLKGQRITVLNLFFSLSLLKSDLSK